MSSSSELQESDIEANELDEAMEILCNSKAEEFQLLGYEAVDGKDVWLCISDKYNKIGTPQLHQIVNDILSLKVTKYMNWLTMRMYKGL